MKSIIQANPHYCFLCGRNVASDPLDLHHCFGCFKIEIVTGGEICQNS